MLVEGDLELGFLQMSIAMVAEQSATTRETMRLEKSASRGVLGKYAYSANLVVSANSVKSLLRSFCKYGRPDMVVDVGRLLRRGSCSVGDAIAAKQITMRRQREERRRR